MTTLPTNLTNFSTVSMAEWRTNLEASGITFDSLVRTLEPALTTVPLYEGSETPAPVQRRKAGWKVGLAYVSKPGSALVEELENDRGFGLERAWITCDPKDVDLVAVAEVAPVVVTVPVEVTHERLTVVPNILHHAPRAGESWLACGAMAAHAGATASTELAVAIGFVLDGLRAGAHQDDIWVQLAGRGDLYLDIAKFRAARWLTRGITSRSGANASVHLVARAGWRDRTGDDEWNSLLYATIDTYAAIVGGADEIVADPLTMSDSSKAAHRWALAVQTILRDESHLDDVVDPGRGSAYIEALTRQIAQVAWAKAQRLEQMGGVCNAIHESSLAEVIQSIEAEEGVA